MAGACCTKLMGPKTALMNNDGGMQYVCSSMWTKHYIFFLLPFRCAPAALMFYTSVCVCVGLSDSRHAQFSLILRAVQIGLFRPLPANATVESV